MQTVKNLNLKKNLGKRYEILNKSLNNVHYKLGKNLRRLKNRAQDFVYS